MPAGRIIATMGEQERCFVGTHPMVLNLDSFSPQQIRDTGAQVDV
jgi:hypothetical protein